MKAMNRRDFLVRAAFGVTAGASLLTLSDFIAACGGSTTTQSGASATPGPNRPFMVVAAGGGQYQTGEENALIKPTLLKLNITNWKDDINDYAKVQTQEISHQVTWDIDDVNEYFSLQAGQKGWLEPIDYTVVDKSMTAAGGAHQFGIAFTAIGRTMAYNTKSYSASNHPTTWEQFWDVKAFPGKRAFWASPVSGIIEAALLADGVAASALYPLDLTRAFQKMDVIRPQLLPAASGAALFQMYVANQADLSLALEGRLNNAIDAGAPWAPEWHNSFVQRDAFVILKGTPYAHLANQVIAGALQPEAQARFTELTGYGPINQQAFDLIDPKYQGRFAYSPAQKNAEVIAQDPTWWAANIDQVNTLWTAWVSK